ncbi:hypothetical protein JAAARDRAFT_383716 [Jaapia argillacea MUCL 33604]|uniref:Uncharacterized protein n=1 Tax=Jaapia argillacea MUCL 33604 TaxID=933084 RepID=A0A067QLR9_9AGAM|nr:hypothetical protein JAAARDRAFT_383716 [Jaapia argillacea MUCL 33604]
MLPRLLELDSRSLEGHRHHPRKARCREAGSSHQRGLNLEEEDGIELDHTKGDATRERVSVDDDREGGQKCGRGGGRIVRGICPGAKTRRGSMRKGRCGAGQRDQRWRPCPLCHSPSTVDLGPWKGTTRTCPTFGLCWETCQPKRFSRCYLPLMSNSIISFHLPSRPSPRFRLHELFASGVAI